EIGPRRSANGRRAAPVVGSAVGASLTPRALDRGSRGLPAALLRLLAAAAGAGIVAADLVPRLEARRSRPVMIEDPSAVVLDEVGPLDVLDLSPVLHVAGDELDPSLVVRGRPSLDALDLETQPVGALRPGVDRLPVELLHLVGMRRRDHVVGLAARERRVAGAQELL